MERFLHIAICEDVPEDTARLVSIIEENGVPSDCDIFTNGEDFLASFSAGKYDLIFLDIYMKGMNGIEAAGAIRQKDENVVLAFTTSSPDHTRDGYRLNALKYIDKPVGEKDVKDAIELALIKQKSRLTVAITAAGGIPKEVFLDTITYFEHKNHAVQTNTTEGSFMSSRLLTLDKLEEQLPSPPFLRCHRSYIVNMDYIQGADKEINAFIMKNGDRADIRRGEFEKSKSELHKWRIQKAMGDI